MGNDSLSIRILTLPPMENYIPMAFLNDFIFCPRSIYFHQLYGKFNYQVYKQKPQILGTQAHQNIDQKKYSSRKTILQGLDVYAQQYKICGRIDVFDVQTGVLTERKRQIKTVYDGYVFQVYAHFFALTEMGYQVKKIVLHDLLSNKNYLVALPQDAPEMLAKFEQVLTDLHNFDLESTDFQANPSKCAQCIYANLCDFCLC